MYGVGVPAAHVRMPHEPDDTPWAARGFLECVEHPLVPPTPIVGLPIRFGNGPHRFHARPAPMVGADTVHVLRNVLSNDERVVTIEIIQKFVADYFQLRPNELKSRNNSKSIALPRQVAMYMCKMLTRHSLPEIGKAFGGKHHSTVIHSIQKIEGMRQRDAEFSALLQNLLANFQ